jgi:F-type H+-transporting ATPase subunit b
MDIMSGRLACSVKPIGGRALADNSEDHAYAATGETVEHASGGSFPPFDQVDTFASQIVWFVLCFAVLYLLLSRVILPKIGRTLERRSDQIANDLDEAARLNDQANQARIALDQRLTEARTKARDTTAKARANVEAEIAAESAKTEVQLAERQEAADKRIASVRAAALSNVNAIAADVTEALVGHLMGGERSRKDVEMAVSAVANRGNS